MRVGIDCRKIEDFGIGTYIRGLLHALVGNPASREVDGRDDHARSSEHTRGIEGKGSLAARFFAPRAFLETS